jgi:hypothetical protein
MLEKRLAHISFHFSEQNILHPTINARLELSGGLFLFVFQKGLKNINKEFVFRYFRQRVRICEAPPPRRGLGVPPYIC